MMTPATDQNVPATAEKSDSDFAETISPELESSVQGAFDRTMGSPKVGNADVQGQAAPLHRVIDVPLPVTLRFGQRQLTLRELLALNTGSLVELDRQVEEPVDLMLGERVIARGEVVIVDGNYGMRVTEVVERAAHRLPYGADLGHADSQSKYLPQGIER